jgi:hypothetical protein
MAPQAMISGSDTVETLHDSTYQQGSLSGIRRHVQRQ